MKTFLEIVANDLYTKLDGNFENVSVVFPNKRASIFFNSHLARISDKPIWAPRYTTISELFQSLSTRTLADPILLVAYLYRSYVSITGSQETLDRFYSWGEMLISDFDDVDKNMADASKLFANISDLQNMTDFGFLEEDQVKAIQQFFVNFNPEDKTKLKEKFLSFWNILYPLYNSFRESLASDNLAYEGMMNREIIESIKSTSVIPASAESDLYVFVGFNVLNETERSLFRIMQKQGKALFYWDYDEAYIAPGQAGQSTFEAGRFIRENIRDFGSALDPGPQYANFRKPKNIHFISSPTENAQARYVSSWLGGVLNDSEPYNETAVVLCNEQLLPAILHSLPSQLITGKGKSSSMLLNVTMGYPLTDTPISSYVSALLKLQTDGASHRGEWRYRQVADILKHPYTSRLSSFATGILRTIRKNNMIYVPDSLFASDSALSRIFVPTDSTLALLRYLSEMTEIVGRSYMNEDKSDFNIQLYAESIYTTHSIINRLITICETGMLTVTPNTVARLIHQITSSRTIPFHGEPAIGLQVMGLLETRCLDFRNVIMLSVNEGQLPKSTHASSFIPYTLREAYGMTTIDKKTSLYAYYFYRLMQRAENITLMYNNSTDGLSKGEMSRFMLQMLLDNGQLFARGQSISQSAVSSPNEASQLRTLSVAKDKSVMENLYNRYDLEREAQYKKTHGDKDMLLTPSAINCYLDCPLKFYFQYGAGMRISDDVTEEVDNAMFGTIFHSCMEHIYGPHIGRQLQSSQLLDLAKDRATLERVADRAFAKEYFHKSDEYIEQHGTVHLYNGEQLLNRHVIVSYLMNQLTADAELCPMTILGVEIERYLDIEVPSARRFTTRIGGIIDRYDRITTPTGSLLRIVDYKTSTRPHKANSLEDLFDKSNAHRPYHILQAFYYSDVVSATEHEPISPALAYIKQTSAGSSPAIKIGKEEITDFASQVKDEYHEMLVSTIAEIFNPDVPFSQTDNVHHCEFCDFRTFCGR